MNNIINHLDDINKISQNPYFINLPNLSLEQFVKSQKSFIHAINNWSKVLAILIGRTDDPKNRIILLDNLNEENGNGDLSKTHVNTFRELLKLCDYTGECNIEPHIYIFNKFLLDYVQNGDYNIAVAILGAIEYTYITVSKLIYEYLSKYIDVENKETHYHKHEIIDYKHATDLFSIVGNENVIKGLDIGYMLLYDLYVEMDKLVR